MMRKIIIALTFCLLSVHSVAKDLFSFTTKNFNAEFFAAYGESAQNAQDRMTHVSLVVSDDDSTPMPGVTYDGRVIGYDPKDYFLLKIKAHQGEGVLIDALVSIPKSQPLIKGYSWIVPQAGMGFALISYQNGVLKVERAVDPKAEHDFLRRSQANFKIEISPDFSMLKSIEWQHYNLKKVTTLILGVPLFDKKEMIAKISARFEPTEEASSDSKE